LVGFDFFSGRCNLEIEITQKIRRDIVNKKERKRVIMVLEGMVLISLSHRSDKFRWVYWPCRGERYRRVLKRDELMEEINRDTAIGKAYLQEIANKIADDLET